MKPIKELIELKVLEALGKGLYRVSYKGKKILAKSKVPLYPGEKVVLKEGDVEFPFERIEVENPVSRLLKLLDLRSIFERTSIPSEKSKTPFPRIKGIPKEDAEELEKAICKLYEAEKKGDKLAGKLLDKITGENIVRYDKGFFLELPLKNLNGTLRLEVGREKEGKKAYRNLKAYLSITFSDGVLVKAWLKTPGMESLDVIVSTNEPSLFETMKAGKKELVEALENAGFKEAFVEFVLVEGEKEEDPPKLSIVDYRV